MKDPIYVTVSKVQETIRDLSETCANGVDSWDKYNQLVGRVRGLKESLDIINSILQEDEEKDNEY